MFYKIIMVLTCTTFVNCVDPSIYEIMSIEDKAIVDAFNAALVFYDKTDVKTITMEQFLRLIGEDDDTKQIILRHFKKHDISKLAAELNDYMFFDLMYAIAHGRGVSPDSLSSKMFKEMIRLYKQYRVDSSKSEDTSSEAESSSTNQPSAK